MIKTSERERSTRSISAGERGSTSERGATKERSSRRDREEQPLREDRMKYEPDETSLVEAEEPD